MNSSRPYYNKALKALNEAHKACYKCWEKDTDRNPVGMSHGPFSGVNEVLGIVSQLESDLRQLTIYKDSVNRILNKHKQDDTPTRPSTT
jgi:hypothetical protein